ncbi:hypothetical protein NRB_17500 [Novosphingobium sp. 11B]
MAMLLSTQALLDTLGGEQRIMAWHSATPANQVELSAVSIGQVLDLLAGIAHGGRRQAFENALNSFVALVNNYGNVVAFDEACARQWPDLLGVPLPHVTSTGVQSDLSAASRMVVATALARNATLIEDPQPYHAQVGGLRVQAP